MVELKNVRHGIQSRTAVYFNQFTVVVRRYVFHHKGVLVFSQAVVW